MHWHNLFIPHRETHQRAKLLSWEAVIIYILIFLAIKTAFSLINIYQPGILGINSQVDQKNLIELTNKERAKLNLPPLIENNALDRAAVAKAKNMFSENYWSHFAPSGKTPWDFILSSGYKFSFAGENLAKNFYNSPDIVAAWMASNSHRENILNPEYKEIGIAVVEGRLNGQKTTLIVQMFGTTQALAKLPEVKLNGQNFSLTKEDYNRSPQLLASFNTQKLSPAMIDPFVSSKIIGSMLLSFIAVLVILDFIVLRERGVLKVTSHHFAHLALISAATATLLSSNSGSIL